MHDEYVLLTIKLNSCGQFPTPAGRAHFFLFIYIFIAARQTLKTFSIITTAAKDKRASADRGKAGERKVPPLAIAITTTTSTSTAFIIIVVSL